jgi:hypothetical protein
METTIVGLMIDLISLWLEVVDGMMIVNGSGCIVVAGMIDRRSSTRVFRII